MPSEIVSGATLEWNSKC